MMHGLTLWIKNNFLATLALKSHAIHVQQDLVCITEDGCEGVGATNCSNLYVIE